MMKSAAEASGARLWIDGVIGHYRTYSDEPMSSGTAAEISPVASIKNVGRSVAVITSVGGEVRFGALDGPGAGSTGAITTNTIEPGTSIRLALGGASTGMKEQMDVFCTYPAGRPMFVRYTIEYSDHFGPQMQTLTFVSDVKSDGTINFRPITPDDLK